MDISIFCWAGNTPFNQTFVREFLLAIDCGVPIEVGPYCRFVLLPQSVAMSQTQNRVHGVFTVTIPSKIIAFRVQELCFDRTDPDPIPHRDQPLSVVV